MSVSTHVLDAASGRPAVGVPVRLEDGTGAVIGETTTDDDGRAKGLADDLGPGTYRLHFDLADRDGFFPEVTIAFRVSEGAAHHHVPLLLSPFSYTTYRGS